MIIGMEANSAARNTSVPGSGEKVEPVCQRIRRRRGDDWRFALHDCRGLAVLDAVRARPVEFPDRKAEALGTDRGARADPRVRAQRLPPCPHFNRAVTLAGGFKVDRPAKLPIWPMSTVTIRMA
jgi:hypothetical protein